jgi:hypothetical protein
LDFFWKFKNRKGRQHHTKPALIFATRMDGWKRFHCIYTRIILAKDVKKTCNFLLTFVQLLPAFLSLLPHKNIPKVADFFRFLAVFASFLALVRKKNGIEKYTTTIIEKCTICQKHS